MRLRTCCNGYMDSSLLRLALSSEEQRTELEVRRGRDQRNGEALESLLRTEVHPRLTVKVKHGEGELWMVLKLQAWVIYERPANEQERAAFLATYYGPDGKIVPPPSEARRSNVYELKEKQP